MRTVRCSDCWGCLPGGVCLPGGCLPREGCLPGGVCPGGVSARGCVWPGMCLPGGMCIPACTEAETLPLWTEWQTGVKTLPCHNFVADGKYQKVPLQPAVFLYLSLLFAGSKTVYFSRSRSGGGPALPTLNKSRRKLPKCSH